MIVDGRVHFSGALKEVAVAQLERLTAAPTQVELSLEATLEGETLDVHVRSQPGDGPTMNTDAAKVGLFAALVQPQVKTQVPRGENAGKELIEHWVVRDFAGPKLFRSAKALNDTEFTLTVPADFGDATDGSVVAFAQELATMHIAGVQTASISQ